MNTLIGEKVSIVSKTPQTTQRPVRGIYTDEQMQVIFLDVPGFHQSVRDWNQQLNDVVLRSLEESDGILRLIDASRSAGKEEQLIDELLEKVNKPVITVYSKIDTVDGRGTVHCASTIPPDAMVLSSETEEGIPEILTAIKDVLPQ